MSKVGSVIGENSRNIYWEIDSPEKIEQDGTVTPATYYEAGEYTINVSTSGDGSASYELFEYADETSWSVKETTAPNGYYKSEDGEQTLGGNTFKNKRQKGKITITKVDNENSYMHRHSGPRDRGPEVDRGDAPGDLRPRPAVEGL